MLCCVCSMQFVNCNYLKTCVYSTSPSFVALIYTILEPRKKMSCEKCSKMVTCREEDKNVGREIIMKIEK